MRVLAAASTQSGCTTRLDSIKARQDDLAGLDCFVPKRNGKSTLFSGLSLYLLAGDREPGAEIYSAAVDRWSWLI